MKQRVNKLFEKLTSMEMVSVGTWKDFEQYLVIQFMIFFFQQQEMDAGMIVSA